MAEKNRPNYFLVWVCLVVLVIVSIAASSVLPKRVAVSLIFSVATIKALLVALNYMHLKYEKRIFYAFAIAPLVIVIILMFALFPDFVFHG